MSLGFVVLEFTETGYVRDTGEGSLDPAVILKKLEKKVADQNQQTAKNANPNVISTVEWVIQPEYNRDDHLLEWAIRADNGTGQTVNHVVRLLGREGWLDGIAVQPHQLGVEPIPLRRLMLGVTFKSGHTYADYRKGDRMARESLADIITADETDNVKTPRLGLALIWVCTGLLLLGGSAGGWTVFRKFKKRAEKSRAAARMSTAPLAHGPLVHANGNGNGNGNGQTVNGNGNGTNGNGHHKMRRRKVFNYQKYYADLLSQVSDRAMDIEYVAPALLQNGTSRSNGFHEDKTLGANLGLIENQKTLIEEQQRLIREQTKLIEEKTRLIQEKNQVLEKQAELFGNNVF